MKTLVLALGLGAALAAPLRASAMTQTDTAPVANHFLIVDQTTGRTLATLLPVDGKAHEFRLIGNVAAPPVALAQPGATAAPMPLTVGQQEQAREAAYRAQFHIPDATP